jgi:hypothetical protein
MRRLLLPTCVLAVVATLVPSLGGCGFLNLFLPGSGVLVTESRDLEGFVSVDASSGFRVDIEPGQASALLLQTDDNVMPHVRASVVGGTLVLAVEPGHLTLPTTLRASVCMPELRGLTLSGGSAAEVAPGFGTAATLTASLSGGSRAALGAIACGGLAMELSGGSTLGGTVSCPEGSAVLTLTGGSQVSSLAGEAASLDIEQSGGGDSDVSAFGVRDAVVDLSGGAVARVDAERHMTVSLSGGSRLLYRVHQAGPTITAIDISGGSSLVTF